MAVSATAECSTGRPQVRCLSSLSRPAPFGALQVSLPVKPYIESFEGAEGAEGADDIAHGSILYPLHCMLSPLSYFSPLSSPAFTA